MSGGLGGYLRTPRDWQARHSVLTVAFLAALSTNVIRVAISPLLPDITAEFGVSVGAMGVALTGMWVAVAATQLPSGLLADRFGERPVILLSLGLAGAAGVPLALAPSFPVFAVVAVLVGVGVGLYYPAGTALLTRRFENTGGPLGVHAAAGPAGGLVAPLLATWLAARFGWRAGILGGVAVLLVVLLVVARWIGPTPARRPDRHLRGRVDVRELWALLARPTIAYTTAIAVATGYVWQAFVSFFPTFLVEFHGFGAGRAGLYFAVIFAFSAVGLPVVGRLSDRFGRDAILALALTLVAAGFVLFLGLGGDWLLVGVVVAGSGMNWGGVLHSRYMDALGEGEQGTGFGLVRAVSVFLGAAGNLVTGAVATAAGWPAAYGILVVLLAAVVASLVVNRALGLGL